MKMSRWRAYRLRGFGESIMTKLLHLFSVNSQTLLISEHSVLRTRLYDVGWLPGTQTTQDANPVHGGLSGQTAIFPVRRKGDSEI